METSSLVCLDTATVPMMPRSQGDRIGNRYVVREQLGGSGQGEVYVCDDPFEGDVVVVKLLSLESLPPGNPWLEAQALRELKDEHILPIRNADLDAGQPFIVTDRATHGTLGTELVARGQRGLDVDDVVSAIRQACAGVARAHSAGLVHNDLKPENFFLNEQRECLVGDFGGACLIPAGSTAGVPHATTPAITAPEVAAAWGTGVATASIRSDVYSLGAAAYWCLGGERPYPFPPGMGFREKLGTVAAQPLPRLWDRAPHVPKYVAAAIDRAMARNPADRFATVVEFAAALGKRPTMSRRWQRTNEHAAHGACWRGVPNGGGSVFVTCLEQVSKPGKLDITSRHLASGNRITVGCRKGVSARDASRALRSVFRALK
jgi:eukaryotic-like serine/threonine-protein kinase